MKAVHQLHSWSQPPRHLREDFVLLVRARETRIGAWLTVVIPQVLVSREKPHTFANHGAAEVRGEITVTDALVTSLLGRTCERTYDRLAGKACPLPVIG